MVSLAGLLTVCELSSLRLVGIGPKVTQSVITAAFLFAFKDALYDAIIKIRRSTVTKRF